MFRIYYKHHPSSRRHVCYTFTTIQKAFRELDRIENKMNRAKHKKFIRENPITLSRGEEMYYIEKVDGVTRL